MHTKGYRQIVRKVTLAKYTLYELLDKQLVTWGFLSPAREGAMPE
jgi:hypothetical protein